MLFLPMRLFFAAAACFLALSSITSVAQPVQDTVLTWRGYSTEAVTRVQLYRAPPDEEQRPRTVVLHEMAESPGPTTVHDARHLAEIVGRAYGFDPAEAYWVFHIGSFSFAGAEPSARKELFLRATFRRTATGNLSTPQWRVIRRNAVMELTDRGFQN